MLSNSLLLVGFGPKQWPGLHTVMTGRLGLELAAVEYAAEVRLHPVADIFSQEFLAMCTLRLEAT